MEAWEDGLPETINAEQVTQFFATLLRFPENFTPLMQAALDVVRPNSSCSRTSTNSIA